MNVNLIKSVVEIALGVFFIWGLFNEPILAKAEQKLFAKFRRNNSETN